MKRLQRRLEVKGEVRVVGIDLEI